MTKYRIYVDEVGDTGLNHIKDLEHRFLSLTGVIAESSYVRSRIHPELEDIKVRYFDSHPDDPVVLHRKALVNAKWPFQALRDPETRASFDAEMLTLLDNWDYEVITVCLDKQAFVEASLNDDYDSYHYCLTALVEVFSDWLTRCEAEGDVMIETRGSKEDKKLKDHFRDLLENGTASVSTMQFQRSLTSRELKINAKDKNISLQISDLIAHPSRSEILDERGLLGRVVAPFAERIVTVLAKKYYRTEGIMYGKTFAEANAGLFFRRLYDSAKRISGNDDHLSMVVISASALPGALLAGATPCALNSANGRCGVSNRRMLRLWRNTVTTGRCGAILGPAPAPGRRCREWIVEDDIRNRLCL